MSATLTPASLADQYRALTAGCGLVERGDRGKLALTGADAVEFLNGQVTNELADLAPGGGRYAAFLTHKGKMLGDLRILALAEEDRDAGGEPRSAPADSPVDGASAGRASAGRSTIGEAPHRQDAVAELLIDTERVALQALFDMIRRFTVGYRVELHKRTLERELLSLVGPNSDRVAAAALARAAAEPRTDLDPRTAADPRAPTDTRAALPGRAEHEHLSGTIALTPVRLIRTDLGLDLLFAAAASEAVRAALRQAGAVPVCEDAAEIVRVESGRPRYGVDLDQSTIPQEGGLNERAVNFTKGCYVGQETVARLHYRGKPNRHLRGLLLSEPVEAGAELRLRERAVGTLTSSVLSPARGPIGLALVRREAELGATLTVGDGKATATVVELPFG